MPLASLFQLSIAPTLKQGVAPLNVSGETRLIFERTVRTAP